MGVSEEKAEEVVISEERGVGVFIMEGVPPSGDEDWVERKREGLAREDGVWPSTPTGRMDGVPPRAESDGEGEEEGDEA